MDNTNWRKLLLLTPQIATDKESVTKADQLFSSIVQFTNDLALLVNTMRPYTLPPQQCELYYDSEFHCLQCRTTLFNCEHLKALRTITIGTQSTTYYFQTTKCGISKCSDCSNKVVNLQEHYIFHTILCKCKNQIGIIISDSSPVLSIMNNLMLIDTSKVCYSNSNIKFKSVEVPKCKEITMFKEASVNGMQIIDLVRNYLKIINAGDIPHGNS